MGVFLNGLKIQFYRGIGGNEQSMTNFSKFNFFIGANNSGKSTVLSFIADHLSDYGSHNYKAKQLDGLDQHHGSKTGQLRAATVIPTRSLFDCVKESISRIGSTKEDHPQYSLFLDQILNICDYYSEDDNVLVDLPIPLNSQSLGRRNFNFGRKVIPGELSKLMEPYKWRDLWTFLRNRNGGGLNDHWIPEVVDFIRDNISIKLPAVGIVPAIRQIGPKNEEYSDFSGRGLIDKLAAIQNPDFRNRDDKYIFDSINSFINFVTGSRDAKIQIPHDRKHILVEIGQKQLPLNSLGTGIQEVIMIAAFCITSNDMIICIEEPELHLHPILQRKLIRKLEETSNQYFIATHSAAFIDTPAAAIFHVENGGDEVLITEATRRAYKNKIVSDLGYKASDILQSNAIIWVEGPSDRVYLKKWLKEKAEELVEGIHFSIMFYGGRLLSHLSGDNEDIGEFINLIAMNRNSAIVIDSDRGGAGEDVNATKKRVTGEIKKSGGLAWITDGREIENYVDYNKLQSAVRRIHAKSYESAFLGGKYKHSLYYKRKPDSLSEKPKQSIEKFADKIKIARLVCEDPTDFRILDLNQRVSELVEFVRKANGLP
jgi:predicted ATPase